MLISQKLCTVELFRQNYWPTGYVWRVANPISPQKFVSSKVAANLNFKFFCKKLQNTKMFISHKPCDIERFQRNLWPRGYLSRVAIPILKKNCLIKHCSHFEFSNFSQKLQNTKMLISCKPCEIEWFRRNFWPTDYLCRVAIPIFKNIFSCQKLQPFWIFELFAKNCKTQKC